MPNSLREDVEALAVQLEEYQEVRSDYDSGRASRSEWAADRLREILARHPAADGVVTDSEVIAARQTFERKLRELCDSYGTEIHYETTGRMGASPASVNGKWATIREFVRAYVFKSNRDAMAQARECDKRWAADGVVVPRILMHGLTQIAAAHAVDAPTNGSSRAHAAELKKQADAILSNAGIERTETKP